MPRTMEAWLDPGGLRFAFLLLLAAGAGFFFASRAAADALLHNPHGRPLQLAIGHWMVIACVCFGAMFAGHPEIAICVIFATSVACLTLVMGIMAYVAPMSAPPGEGRAIWPFVLPASVIALLAGLSGRITFVHAGALLLLGIALVPVAIGRDSSPTAVAPRRSWSLASVQLALALMLAGLAAWAAVKGADQLHQRSRFFSTSLIVSALIAPALILPVLSSSSSLIHRGQSTLALTVNSGIALLNLCLLLPSIALLWYIQPLLRGQTMIDAWMRLNDPLIYPLLLWRLDTFILIAIGVMLLPVSTGRWTLGQREGIGLIVGYGMYLILTIVNNVR